MTTIFEAAGGEPGLRSLAAAWHRRVLADPVLAPVFADVREDHVDRLAAYWAEALGGPARYTDRYGTEAGLVRLHRRDEEHAELNDHAVDCFADALDDVGLTGDERLAEALLDYFTWVTWTTLSPRVTPARAGSGVPKWSWDGLDEWP